jgi:hypothetical protein
MKVQSAVLFLILTARALLAATPDSLCLSCHDEKSAAFPASVHSTLGCTGCHSDIKGFPHPDQVAKVSCANCHSDVATKLTASVHANAAPQPCASCHGDPHAVVPVKDPKSPVYALNLPKTCGSCHGDKKFIKGHNLPNVLAQYTDSIHGFALSKDGLLVAATCSSCHGAHDILPPADPKSRVNRANVPATCGTCHQGIVEQYASGVHGQALAAGNAKAPVCDDCHTAHQISNVRDASFQMKTTATCGNCHKEKYGTYHDTFHAQVSALSYVETARCWDCHGSHVILPASNPKSTVAKANLVQTCGKCHEGANAGFVSYQPHADAHDGSHYPLLHASEIFMNLLLASVLGTFFLHTVLWFVRSAADRGAKRSK